MKVPSIILSIACAGAVAGCEQPDALNPDFGNAVRQNMAAQIINPEPANASAGAPDLTGAVAVGSYGRYRTGNVKEPVPLSTKSGGSK